MEDATQMLREDFIRNSYVLHDLLGNAGFAIKLKHFVYAYNQKVKCALNVVQICVLFWKRKALQKAV